MPCSPKRARQMMDKKQAVPYWQKGFFCIKLLKEPSDRKYQKTAVLIDTGSKREGYTTATEKAVVLNIETNTPDWVKEHVETRRNLRRARRQRKTPYRKCRRNRAALKKNRIPPSTKARWDAKIRIVKFLKTILPITHIRIEDICAVSKEGKPAWNKSFSPLETGKKYFEQEIEKLGLKFSKNQGWETANHRKQRGFKKLTGKHKLDWNWEAHNVDSHCLAEIEFGTQLKPEYGFYRLEYLQFYRRRLHVQKPIKNNIRKKFGTTVSMGMARGSVLYYQDKLYYLGGNSSKGKIAIHIILTGKRISKDIDPKKIKIMYKSSWRIQYVLFEKHTDETNNVEQRG